MLPFSGSAVLAAQTASFSSLAGRKATFLLAAIWIVAPVAGLRPVRASRWRTSNVPIPLIRIRSPLFKWVVIVSIMPASNALACFWELLTVRKLLDDALQRDRVDRHDCLRRGN